MSDNRYDRQISREKDAVTDGIARYELREANKSAHDTEPSKVFIARNIAKVVRDIDRMREYLAKRPISQQPTWYLLTLEIPTLELAWLALAGAITGAASESNTMTAGSKLGQSIQQHIFLRKFEEAAKEQAKWAEAKTKTMPQEFRRHRHLDDAALKAGIERPGWTNDEDIQVGCSLIDIVMESTGLLVENMRRKGTKTPIYYELSDAARDQRDDINNACKVMRPLRRWMVIAPKDWTSIDDGGYLLADDYSKLVRRPTPYQREVLESPPSDYINALNVMQRTPFIINKAMLLVIEMLKDAGDEMIPAPEQIDVTVVPDELTQKKFDGTATDAELDEHKALSIQRALDFEYRATMEGKQRSLDLALNEARSLLDEDAIWTPLSVDFRGRAYPQASGLSYQGNDIQKSLLLFANGEPVGPDGARWLHIAWSNAFGHDKVSMADRVQFTLDHIEAIKATAENPLDPDAIWRGADEPFQCLALCFELVNLYEIGEDYYVSHMPIGVDATASGLQHYAALMRDPTAAEAVCLTEMDVPNDLYTQVKDIVDHRLDNGLCDQEVIDEWKGNVTRNTVKQCCMTLSYGATAFGRREQIADSIEHIPNIPSTRADRNAAGKLLEPIVFEAIGQVVTSSLRAMEWLQSVTKLVIESGASLEFNTPLGFPLHQEYWTKVKRTPCRIWCESKRREAQPVEFDRTRPLKSKHCTAIAANFVHGAGDATHMFMTVNLLESVGVTDFRTVHDSVAVHPGNVSELIYGLKLAFIDLYGEDQDWLLDFERQMIARVDDETAEKIRALQPLRQQLDHDISDVLDAEFFFG